MQLSKRLETVAKQVTKGSRVADIGCDHAYVSIYLAEQNVASHVIAMDINRGPLERAKENIRNNGLEDRIETRLSDGAKELNSGEADTILIGGMGGALMIKILKDSNKVASECKEFILQPQSEVFLVREYLKEINYNIIYETMLYEEGQYYVIIKAEKSVIEPSIIGISRNNQQIAEDKRIYYLYGRYLLESRNLVLKDYLIYKQRNNQKLLENLADIKTDKVRQRKEELLQEQQYILEGLSYYEM